MLLKLKYQKAKAAANLGQEINPESRTNGQRDWEQDERNLRKLEA